MINRRLLLPGLILSLLVLGCSKKSEPGGEGADSGAGRAERRFLSIGTAPPGGAFFVVGSAIGEVIEAHNKTLGWRVSTEATKGTQENLRRLDRGEMDLALANAAISFFAVRGQEKWEKEYPIRTVMTLAPNIAFFITPKSSGIKSIADLKDRRVVVGPAGAGFEHFIKPILAAHGISYDDMTPLNDTQGSAVGLLADGSADAAFLGGAVPTSSITQACTSQSIHFIPFETQAMDSLVDQYRFFDRKTIPAGTYTGQEEAYDCLNVGNMILVTSAEVDDETIYRVTKTVFEHAAEVVKKHPAGKAIKAKNVIRETGTPFHPGAIRYYKEAGIWPADRE